MSWSFINNKPIYTQVMDYIKKDICAGTLKLGSTLPDHRLIAANTGVSPSAVLHAYDELVASGLLYNSQDGYVVTSDACTITDEQTSQTQSLVTEFCSKILELGVTHKQIITMVCDELTNQSLSSDTNDMEDKA